MRLSRSLGRKYSRGGFQMRHRFLNGQGVLAGGKLIHRNFDREVDMSSKRTLLAHMGAAGIAAFLLVWPSQVGAQQLRIGSNDIGGVVTSAKGPEAGVWVIAETTGLGTK